MRRFCLFILTFAASLVLTGNSAVADDCRLIVGENYLYVEGFCAKDCLEEEPPTPGGLAEPGEGGLCPVGGGGGLGHPWNPNGRLPGVACDFNSECASAECSSACLWDTLDPAEVKGCCSQTKDQECLEDGNCQSNVCRRDGSRPGKCRKNPTTGGDNRPDGSVCSNHRDCKSNKCRTDASGSTRKCVP